MLPNVTINVSYHWFSTNLYRLSTADGASYFDVSLLSTNIGAANFP